MALRPWGGLGVLGIWAAAALVLGALAFRLRDALLPERPIVAGVLACLQT